MLYGPMPARRLPAQNTEKIRAMADRFLRAKEGHAKWAEAATECVDFVEGRQWTAEQLRKLAQEKRPALTINKIAPLVRLVAGYFRNNRTDYVARPANEGQGSEDVGEILGKILKQISTTSRTPYVEAEVFMDGIMGGRGFFDTRLDFSRNDLGEAKVTALDPFNVMLDPDASDYDINGHAYVINNGWMDIDAVEATYGPEAAKYTRPFLGNQSWGGFLEFDGDYTKSPIRHFGEVEDEFDKSFRNYFNSEFIDRYRSSVRVIDMQHRVTTWGPCFIDMETGDKIPVPSSWNKAKIDKALFHAQQMNNPLVVQHRAYQRVRWTVMIGDVIVHDDWSIYDRYTISGYFPYFRRGVTRGMVHDLLDPQREANKRRSAEVHIVGTSANSGWLINSDVLTPEEQDNFKRNSGKSGFIGIYKGDPGKKPEKINPNPPPMAMERLEKAASDDIREVSGINPSALGEVDKVQSGRAIEARQRQAVIGIQVYMDNFKQTKELLGQNLLEIVQRHYTEERVFRIVGEDGRTAQIVVNQRQMGPDGVTVVDRLNDITAGKYVITMDETPMSATFQNAQFEEMMSLLEKLGPVGAMAAQIRPDLIIDMSSLPRKREWTEALAQAAGAAAAPPGAPPGMPPGPGGGVTQAPSLDQGNQPGGNVVQLQPTGRAAAV